MKVLSVLVMIFKTFPKRLPVIVVLMFASGLLETVGIGIMVPIIEFFFEERSYEGKSFISQQLLSFLKLFGFDLNLRLLFGFLVLFFGLKSIVKFVESVLTYQLERHFFRDLSNQLFKSFSTQQWLSFQRKKVGFYHSIFVNEMNEYIHCIRFAIHILSESLLLIFYLSLSFIISWKLSLFILFFLGISFVGFRSFFNKGKDVGERVQSFKNDYNSYIVEFFNVIKWVKTAGKHDISHITFSQKLNAITQQQFIANCYRAVLPAFFLTFAALSLAVISYICLVVIKINFATMILLLTLFYRALPKFQLIQQTYQSFLIFYPNIHFIDTLLSESEQSQENFGTTAYNQLHAHIQLEKLTFSYESHEQSFNLNNLSLTINKNQFVAIVGPSGSGKSTLIDLLLGLVTPQSGAIKYDDINIQDYNIQQLRAHVGLVSQDILLLNTSIKENLTWGLSDISDTTIQAACDAAHATEFIDKLADGLHTIIGERGVRLSGGQRQRLGLARALVMNPDILILDEATSALDAESEQFVQNTIHNFKGKKTIILISHRLASVKQADHIVVLDKGDVIEQGTWDELSGKKGKFELFKRLQILD
ncbi:hypothetical protein DID76_00760 [Candidatus Marinamargulisbacteria bacterium SCGC AG-414-C22]|nr:hypothetical protein DID76_00760 [Candidatus Marinamargulisbacteria bacterium SCGC AG-414-C22]